MRADSEELYRLESVYLNGRNDSDFNRFFTYLVSYMQMALAGMMKKGGFYINCVDRKIISHDAATRLCEMYIKYPDQESMPLPSRVNLELKYQLYNPKKQKIDKESTISINHKIEKLPRKDAAFFIDKIVESSTMGKRVVIDLYRHRYYRWAILAIDKYMPRPWIREHAVELKTIFDMVKK